MHYSYENCAHHVPKFVTKKHPFCSETDQSDCEECYSGKGAGNTLGCSWRSSAACFDDDAAAGIEETSDCCICDRDSFSEKYPLTREDSSAEWAPIGPCSLLSSGGVLEVMIPASWSQDDDFQLVLSEGTRGEGSVLQSVATLRLSDRRYAFVVPPTPLGRQHLYANIERIGKDGRRIVQRSNAFQLDFWGPCLSMDALPAFVFAAIASKLEGDTAYTLSVNKVAFNISFSPNETVKNIADRAESALEAAGLASQYYVHKKLVRGHRTRAYGGSVGILLPFFFRSSEPSSDAADARTISCAPLFSSNSASGRKELHFAPERPMCALISGSMWENRCAKCDSAMSAAADSACFFSKAADPEVSPSQSDVFARAMGEGVVSPMHDSYKVYTDPPHGGGSAGELFCSDHDSEKDPADLNNFVRDAAHGASSNDDILPSNNTLISWAWPRDMAAGKRVQCSLFDAIPAMCWASKPLSVQGYNAVLDNLVSIPRYSKTTRYSAISNGGYHICGVGNGGDLTCWGSAVYEKTLYGEGAKTTSDVEGRESTPAITTAKARSNINVAHPRFRSISTSISHSCAITTIGSLTSCWGSSEFNAWPCEDDSTCLYFANNAAQIVAGLDFTCILWSDSHVTCFGGQDDYISKTVPANVSFTRLCDGGLHHVCGVSQSGIECWGRDLHGEVNNAPKGNYVDVACGELFSCAEEKESGDVVCWGKPLKGNSMSIRPLLHANAYKYERKGKVLSLRRFSDCSSSLFYTQGETPLPSASFGHIMEIQVTESVAPTRPFNHNRLENVGTYGAEGEKARTNSFWFTLMVATSLLIFSFLYQPTDFKLAR